MSPGGRAAARSPLYDHCGGSQPPIFPLAVISNGERFPYTDQIELGNGDQLFVLTRKTLSASAPSTATEQ